MTRRYEHIGLDQPAAYMIRIQGRLDNDLSSWFDGESSYAVETGQPGAAVTCLTGRIADQAALHGLIGHIRDLGLVLLYVDCLSAHAASGEAGVKKEWRDHE